MINHITTKWLGGMKFESTNPSGNNLFIEASPENGEQAEGYRPKALMLSALAGCSGLDVASLIKKMKLDVADFSIEIDANLTDEDPKFYDKVTMAFHFFGSELNEKKLQRAVDLSVEKYCGVMEMFRQFAELSIETHFHNKNA
ncbi:osmotically inducible protein OsmC [Pseudalgibacter alginicilyticus]|uniref:Osmotically inducible protein OsmC n=1 Tax=Pseudalgibacter alginicilyticus TaxID=1736674 RepID=A0A0P0CHM2_9FLAO|nr:OsmC family protein [Pseudalgibacter alginicilyticus]ALJ05673.1 osmotically inducible protein OsmC [Pseudalgibacter alginicilyticus]